MGIADSQNYTLELYKLSTDLKQIQDVLSPIQDDIKLLNKLATEYGLLIKMLTEAQDKQIVEIEDIEKIVSGFQSIRNEICTVTTKIDNRVDNLNKEVYAIKETQVKVTNDLANVSGYINEVKADKKVKEDLIKKIPILITVGSVIGTGLFWLIKYIMGLQ